MKNVKSDSSYEAKGSISHTLSEKSYFGMGLENVTRKNTGYYSNSHYYILGKMK